MQVRFLFPFLSLILVCAACKKEVPVDKTDLYPVKIGKQYGYINAEGKVAIEPKFFSVNWFNGNRAIVETAPGRKAMIDRNGEIVFQDTTGFLHLEYQDGLVKFETKDKKQCFVDSLGSTRFCLGDSIVFSESAFSCERLLVRVLGGVFAYLDTNGKEVYRFKRGFPDNYQEDIVRRSFKGRTCYFDKNGKSLFCKKGKGSDFQSGVIIIEEKGNRYLVNKEGEIISDILPYDEIATFQEGYALVTKHKKVGVINTKGEVIVPLQYPRMMPFVDGLAFVPVGKTWEIIDTKNKVVPTKKVINEVVFPGFLGKLAFVNMDSTWGYMNRQGDLVWQSAVDPFINSPNQ